MNVKHDILFATVYTSVFFTLTKITANAQNLIYLHTVYTGVFFSYTYRTLYSVRFFSTIILFPGNLQ